MLLVVLGMDSSVQDRVPADAGAAAATKLPTRITVNTTPNIDFLVFIDLIFPP
jgi:hypothetical protein